MSVATFALWLACAVLTITFPFLNKYLGTSGTFLLYAAICMLGLVYMYAKLPETKRKSLEQIELELTGKQ
jgi:SP family sugar porter-like MFS transporter